MTKVVRYLQTRIGCKVESKGRYHGKMILKDRLQQAAEKLGLSHALLPA